MKKNKIVFGIILMITLQMLICVDISNSESQCVEKKIRISENPNSLFSLPDISVNDDLFQKYIKIPSSADMSNVDLPDYFDWRDINGLDWTTSVKDQGNCGSCWVLTALGSLEAIIKIREDSANLAPDLSEQYILSCLPAAATVYGDGCSGGEPLNAFKYMMSTEDNGNNHNGAIFESCLPYQASNDIPCSDKTDNWLEYIVPISDYGRIINDDVLVNSPESIERIKNLIMQHGPSAAFLDVPPVGFQIWGYQPHDPEDYYEYEEREFKNSLNHAVVITGWKDDPSIPNGGYWICKNTWGTNWNYGGFFYIEYGACFIGYWLDWVDYNPNDFLWAPKADSGSLYTGVIGEDIYFNGSGSTRSEYSDIISYHWDFGDGYTSLEMSPTHIYSEAGLYYVNLTIVDKNNNTDSDTAEVVVTSEPISIDLCGGLLETRIEVKNTADFTLYNIDWRLDYINGFPLFFGDFSLGGVITIPPGEHSFVIGDSLGIGAATFKLTIGDIVKEEKVYLMGIFFYAPL